MMKIVSKIELSQEEELRKRTIKFYSYYINEIENIKNKLCHKLEKIAITYAIENKLPKEAFFVVGRTKSLVSALKKLEYKKWPSFEYPTEVLTDLIGARIVCWFVKDCYGISKFIEQHLNVEMNETEDYIATPKPSGYRAIHLSAKLLMNRINNRGNVFELIPPDIKCEIQIKTKLQDAWADITHGYYYKSKYDRVQNRKQESFLADSSARLSEEDTTLSGFRVVCQGVNNDNKS